MRRALNGGEVEGCGVREERVGRGGADGGWFDWIGSSCGVDLWC